MIRNASPGLSNFTRNCLALVAALACSGCASLIASATSRFADNLTTAILEQDDPGLVRDGVPAYLLLLDSLVVSDAANPDVLAAAAQLYAAYAATFTSEPGRARRLSARGFGYGTRAVCLEYKPACTWDESDFDGFVSALDAYPAGASDSLYAYCVAWLAWLRAHSADWSALTDLPRVEAALTRLEKIVDEDSLANVNLYLGVLNTLRPPALGGDPDRGRAFFERALQLSGERDLSIKVEYARGYARLVYDRDLHDRLLNEVLAADPHAPSLTLSNTLAQEQARQLLESANEYF